MTRDTLKDLARLTSAQKSAQEARMQKLISEENEIRRQIADLEESHANARATPPDQMSGLRQIGADILWQGWVSRSRQQLQIKLAQVLARKGAVTRDLRIAHGRNNAAEALCRTAAIQERDNRQKSRVQQEQSLIIMQAAQVRSR